MGILNCTPDSFYDGGNHSSTQALIEFALHMESQGADWIDIGGESTRPGAVKISLQEELDRVLPVIEGIRDRSDISLSVDTTKAKVAQEAVLRGVSMVNDVSGLKADPDMVGVVRESSVKLVLMHSRGDSQTMMKLNHYQDLVQEVKSELEERIRLAQANGIKLNQLILDPGFGFAKDPEQNLLLLKKLNLFNNFNLPLLVGLSRKSVVGYLTGRQDPQERLAGSLVCHFFALQQGAAILRVHDVPQTMDLVRVYQKLYTDSSK